MTHFSASRNSRFSAIFVNFSVGTLVVLTAPLSTPLCLGQATLDYDGSNGFDYTYNLNATGGPTVGDHFFSPFFSTASEHLLDGRQSNGVYSSSQANWDLRADFFNRSGADDFKAFDVYLSPTTRSESDVPGLSGSSGANSELSVRCDLSFTVATNQYYQMAIDGNGGASSAISFSGGFANAQSLGVDSIEYLNSTTRWNAHATDGTSQTAGSEITSYGIFQPGVRHNLSLGSVYGQASSSATAGLFGAQGLSKTNGSSRYQMQLNDVAVGPDLFVLSTRKVLFISGTYSLPILTANQAVNISVGSTASLAVPQGSILNGSLNVDGQLNLDGTLSLSSAGIVGVGAGAGIVAVGAGAGIVAPGAGGGIVAVGAGAGIVGVGAGAGIVTGGAGGMIIAPGAGGRIIAPGAGGGIVAPGAGGGIVAVGAGGYLKGNGIVGNNGNSFTMTVGGNLAVGHSPGLLTVYGDVDFESTADLDFQIGGLLAGDEYDVLEAKATSAGAAGLITLGGVLDVAILDDFQDDSAITTGEFAIIAAEGGIAGEFSNVADGQRLATSDGLGSFLVAYRSNSVVLTNFQSVPEPATWTLALLFVAAGVTVKSRNRSLAGKYCGRRELGTAPCLPFAQKLGCLPRAGDASDRQITDPC